MIAMALVLQSRAADRRRADDRARRDDPGADPRADQRLQRRDGAAMILITHDLGVVADIADRVAVMYARAVVEQGAARRALLRPAAPVHVGAARLDRRALDRDRAPAAAGDPGDAAVAARPAGGLPLPRRAARTRSTVHRGAAARGARRPAAATATAAGSPSRTSARGASPTADRTRAEEIGDRRERRRRRSRCSRSSTSTMHFPVRRAADRPQGRRSVHAVDDVSLRRCTRARRSGSSASRAAASRRSARCVVRLLEPTGGTCASSGADITTAQAGASCGRCGARCRWSSRTRTRR